MNIMEKKIYLTRRYKFSSAHCLHNPQLSEEENLKLYGKCGYQSGHGHDYTLEVTLKGLLEEEKGIIFSRDIMDSIVAQRIINTFDHKRLDTEIVEFKTKIPTGENLLQVIWNRLKQDCSLNNYLYRIRLYETEKSYFEFYGNLPDEK